MNHYITIHESTANNPYTITAVGGMVKATGYGLGNYMKRTKQSLYDGAWQIIQVGLIIVFTLI